MYIEGMYNNLIFSTLFILISTMFTFAEIPLDLKLDTQYYGRWLIEDSVVRTSSPGAAIQFSFKGTKVVAEIEGNSYWKVEIDNKEYPSLLTNTRKKYTVVQGLPAKKHLITLTRKSECVNEEIRVYSILLEAKGMPKQALSNNRRLEFIGDSYTVGYGNEARNSNDGEPFSKTNTTKSFAYLLAKSFKADFQINAFSGRGLVKNFEDIAPEWTIPKLCEYTIPGVAREGNSPKWNFESWHPQVIVIFVGINDWQGKPPYPSAVAFDKAYAELLNSLRSRHPGVQFLLLATHVWPSDEMIPRVQTVFNNEIKNGHKDVTFMTVSTENTALDGHPSIHAHKNLANELRPVIGRLGKWLSR